MRPLPRFKPSHSKRVKRLAPARVWNSEDSKFDESIAIPRHFTDVEEREAVDVIDYTEHWAYSERGEVPDSSLSDQEVEDWSTRKVYRPGVRYIEKADCQAASYQQSKPG